MFLVEFSESVIWKPLNSNAFNDFKGDVKNIQCQQEKNMYSGWEIHFFMNEILKYLSNDYAPKYSRVRDNQFYFANKTIVCQTPLRIR